MEKEETKKEEKEEMCTCSVCIKDFPKKEASKSYTVPVCPNCAKDFAYYGTD